MNVPEVYREATRRGLRLEPRGDKLAVISAYRVPPDFEDVLRRHKHELLDWLESNAADLTPDCIPWLHVARRILAGEFDDADRSTVESLTIGLRKIRRPLIERALHRLRATPMSSKL